MIRTMRSFEIQPGKDAEALDYAKRAARYMNEKSHNEKMEVWLNLSGSVRQLHFIGYYESLSSFDTQMTWMAKDSGFAALTQEVDEKGSLIRQTDRREFFQVLDLDS